MIMMGQKAHLAIEEEEVKSKQAHLHLNILHFHVLPFPLAQLLERQQLPRHLVDSDRLSIQNEALRTLGDAPRELLHQVRVLLAHILAVPREHRDGAVGKLVNLSPLTVVLVLASKLLPFEPVEDFPDRFGGLGEHGLERYPRREFAVRVESFNVVVKEGRDYEIVCRNFTATEQLPEPCFQQ